MIEPDYTRSVHLIPHSILNSFGAHDSGIRGLGKLNNERIILVLVDALGMNLYSSLMNDFGYAIELTSVFPSTTAAAVTSIFTGLTPKEHGILEWYMYYEDYGDVIKTIPFTPMDSGENDALLRMGYNPAKLFSLDTLFGKLKKEGIKGSAYLKRDYLSSSYSRYMLGESELSGYSSLSELEKRVKKDAHPFIYVYIDDLDIVQHAHGPSSEETRKMARKIRGFIERIREKDSTILVAADHGQTEIKKKIEVKVPCQVGGSPRDMFLYCDYETEYYSISPHEILRLLGPGKEHRALRKRMPKKIILPGEHEGVWFKYFQVKGLHGGMSEEEMLVPLIIIEK